MGFCEIETHSSRKFSERKMFLKVYSEKCRILIRTEATN